MKGFGEETKYQKIERDILIKTKDNIKQQAFKLHSQGKIEEAFNSYKEFIKKGYKDPKVFTNLAVIYTEKKNLEVAKKI